jgi:hypothetical protein
MEGVLQYIRYTPVGEYLRLVVLQRLAKGPVPVKEIDKLAEDTIRRLHVRYDWRVWPQLLDGEVEIRDSTATITPRGRWILEQTSEEVARYVQKWLGVSP